MGFMGHWTKYGTEYGIYGTLNKVWDRIWDLWDTEQSMGQNMGFMGHFEPNMGQNMGFMGHFEPNMEQNMGFMGNICSVGCLLWE